MSIKLVKLVKGDDRYFDYKSEYVGITYDDFRGISGGGFGKRDMFVDERIMKAIVEICVYYNIQSVIITSSRRTKEFNSTLPNSSETSRHLYGEAIDFKFFSDDIILHDEYKKDIRGGSDLFVKLYALGVREFFFYKTFNHIAIESGKFQIKDYSKEPSDVVKKNVTKQVKSVERAVLPPVKDYYEYYVQDSGLSTISKLIQDPNSIIGTPKMSKKEILEYQGTTNMSNLYRLWDKYNIDQKNEFSTEYKSLTDKILAATTYSEKDEYIEQRKLVKPKFDDKLDYDINVGTMIIVPKNRTNLEVLSVTGKDIFLVQQNLTTFLSDELKALINDPTYVPAHEVKIINSSYSIRYLHVSFSCWIYIRSIDKILDISPFIISMDTKVSESGDFSFSLGEIDNIYNVEKFSDTLYSYIDKTVNDKYNLSYFHKYIQQNDIVFIRFEKLDIEKKRSIYDMNKWDMFIDKNELPNKIYDMIGLVDTCHESYNSVSAISTISVSGRDFSKLLSEDGSYFMPFALVNGAKDFFLNYNKDDTFFKRIFTTGQFMSTFTVLHRSIRDSLGFIFNQLTNTGVLPKNSDLFNSYKSSFNRITKKIEDRQSKTYVISNSNKEYLDSVEQNGVWKIIKMVIDHQLDSRRLANGELSNPDGPILELINKVCQFPFVEFWGDTIGDQFVFMARQPPYTKSQIQDYFKNNEIISVDADMFNDVSLDWESSYFTWYQVIPSDIGTLGSNQYTTAAFLPIVYFEEFANIFGIHKKVVPDAYIATSVLVGDQSKVNYDLFRDFLANDMKFLVESNMILPFTRKGTITIPGGDRRIKRGMWIYFAPTEEIFYVNSVSNSVSINGDTINRSTVINVDRGMKKKYVIDESGKKIDDKFINYFNIVNIDVIVDRLRIKLDNGKIGTSTISDNSKLINPNMLDFFLKRKQWE